jgi:hypothetical protein
MIAILFWTAVSVVGLLVYATLAVATFHALDMRLLGVGDCRCRGDRARCLGMIHLFVPPFGALLWPSLLVSIPLVWIVYRISYAPARWGAYLGAGRQRKALGERELRQHVKDREQRIAQLEQEVFDHVEGTDQ